MKGSAILSISVRRSLLFLLCVFGLVSGGCIEAIAYRPNENLVENIGVIEAQRRLKEILLHSINPPVVEAEVTDDGFIYRYKQFIAGFATGALLENRASFANAAHVEIFANNVVVVQTSTKYPLARLIFGNEPDTRLFADLVTSFHRRYLQKSAR
jgi:hypothetical protein